MKCSKCGEEINKDQGFCLKCGNPIQLEPDFNSIENELANSVSELLDESEEAPMDELPEDESMVTVDVPYDEINMEIKMVDITKPQIENQIHQNSLKSLSQRKKIKNKSQKNQERRS